MGRRGNRDLVWLLLLLSLIAVWWQVRQQTADAEPSAEVRYWLDLQTGQSGSEGRAPVEVLVPPERGQAVLKLKLDPQSFSEARFRVFYEGTPTGWTVNIGDSRSNNGYGGDGASQSNDAEIQIQDGHLGIFGNDRMGDMIGPAKRGLKTVKDFVEPGNAVEFVVRDSYVGWISPGHSDEMQSEYLFAFQGQEDSEGAPNHDLYAAFNRVIAGGREGSGAVRVEIEFR